MVTTQLNTHTWSSKTISGAARYCDFESCITYAEPWKWNCATVFTTNVSTRVNISWIDHAFFCTWHENHWFLMETVLSPRDACISSGHVWMFDHTLHVVPPSQRARPMEATLCCNPFHIGIDMCWAYFRISRLPCSIKHAYNNFLCQVHTSFDVDQDEVDNICHWLQECPAYEGIQLHLNLLRNFFCVLSSPESHPSLGLDRVCALVGACTWMARLLKTLIPCFHPLDVLFLPHATCGMGATPLHIVHEFHRCTLFFVHYLFMTSRSRGTLTQPVTS